MTVFSRAARLAATTLALLVAAPAIAAEGEAQAVRPASATAPAAPMIPAATAAVANAVKPAVIQINPAFLSPARAAPPLISVPASVLRGPSPLLANQRVAFASLEDAVAAHHGKAAGGEAERCLAGAVFFESKGEPLNGQLAVAQVIMNRAKSGRFASDVCGVVKQRGQFSFVRGGVIPSVDEGRPGWRTALAVAKVALAEAWDGVGSRALFFHARAVGVRAGMTRVAAIGNHVFFR